MLRLVDVHKDYGSPSALTPVLRGISLDVGQGEFCAMTGPSGSGKSTLMNLMGLLDRPSAGRVILDGSEVGCASQTDMARYRNQNLGFVFQSFHLLPRLNAWENVALPLLYRGVTKEARQAPAIAMLTRVGLADRAHHYPETLSGGQRQRVAIARALVGAPRLILADEPTGSLDSATADEIMNLFRDINFQLGVTIVMVTHDRALAERCDRQIELLDGRVIADRRRAPQ